MNYGQMIILTAQKLSLREKRSNPTESPHHYVSRDVCSLLIRVSPTTALRLA
jgi:hypothetical protein